MWTIEQLETKVAEMTKQVEQSASQHHILLGSKLTFDGLLMEAKKAAEAVETDCSKIEQTLVIEEDAYV